MVLKNSFILCRLLVVLLFMVFVLLAVVDVHHDNRIMDNLFIEYIIRAGHGLVCFSLFTLSLLVVQTMHSVFLLSSLRILLHVLRHWHLSPCRHSTVSMRCPIVSYKGGLLESFSCSFLFKSTSVGVHFRFFGAVDYFESVKGKTILSLNGVAGFYKMKIYV